MDSESPGHVEAPHVPPSVTGRSQPVAGVRRPADVAEVVELVRWARETGTPLYPVSRGLNWGYGSASPVAPGCVLVDLSRMNRIRNAGQIGPAEPVAVIEPGVTQRQLHEHLQAQCPSLRFNVTGSALDTSVLGNALDRGVGYFGPRFTDVFGLEFVDGRGCVRTTGFRRLGESSPLAHMHPTGLGPVIDGLLSQSNFGIVTSACFRLMPRRPCEVAVSIGLRPGAALASLLDGLIALKRDGLLVSVAHVGNRARSRSTLRHGVRQYLIEHGLRDASRLEREVDAALDAVASGEWSGLAGLAGNAGQVRACLAEIRARLRGVAEVRVVTEQRLELAYALLHRLRRWSWARQRAAAVSAARPLHGLTLGRPTDAAIGGLLGQFGCEHLAPTELDASNVGLLYVSPALPADGLRIEAILRELTSVAAGHGHALYTTVNIETDLSAVAVINLLFDRAWPADVERAHRCAADLLACIRRAGLEVYRARTDAMPGGAGPDAAHWAFVRELKAVFDPDGLLAPGRYDGTAVD